ncbi:MAG: ABC transporter permease, partial [Nanoarchaeota archaeon]|nr:ABC transporter permease [Nanoarchaeota archaeon]
KLFIMPKGGTWGMGSSEVLTENDLETIKDVSGIKYATGMGYTYGRFEFNELIHYGFISGISPDPEDLALVGEAQTWHILEGRNLEKGDKYKAILGYSFTQTDIFEKRVEVGDKIILHNHEFKIVGFLEKIGSPPDDASAIIPLAAYEEVFDSKDELGFIIAQTQPGEDPLKVAEDTEKELRRTRNVDEGEENFDIQTPEQFAESFNVILDIVQIVLIGIAMISLLVGGIGIMNTMYTSVLQRTKEIGVMKALGARNKHIMYLFLIESGLYGLGGGILGAAIGIGFAKAAELLMAIFIGPAFLSVQIDWLLIVATLAFSFVVGCLSGIAPARKASKLNPVDSLRYE